VAHVALDGTVLANTGFVPPPGNNALLSLGSYALTLIAPPADPLVVPVATLFGVGNENGIVQTQTLAGTVHVRIRGEFPVSGSPHDAEFFLIVSQGNPP
jgi:hypothetical protein